MLAKVQSMGVFGIDAYPVEVEVYVAKATMPTVTIVGLPDTSVKESADRVKAALKNSGYQFPVRSVTVNLAPADRRKEGPAFELPILLGLLQLIPIIGGVIKLAVVLFGLGGLALTIYRGRQLPSPTI